MQFKELKLIEPLQRALQTEGYTTPTPIQAKGIPHILAGRDLVGVAQTGTGKTAAFALPLIQHLSAMQSPRERRVIRALVLAPTRELASQIGDSFAAYGRYTHLKKIVIFGGVGQQPQVDALRRGADVLVATPGRLLDLMHQGHIRLDTVKFFVLDEADRMLDMGFIHDVRKIIAALPKQRQTLLFSATMPQAIQDLADHMLIDPVRVEVTPQATTVETIAQSVFHVEKRNKRALLEHILSDDTMRRVLVFTRTKHGANKLVQQLDQSNIQAEAIHGNKSQTARERALLNFRTGKTRVLVATDIAARGIDVDDVTHVINYELPNEPESYVHRIGRTARAGASGAAYSLCDIDERPYLRDIEKLIRLNVPVVTDHPYAASANGAASSTSAAHEPARRPNGGQRPAANGSRPARPQSAGPRQNGNGSGNNNGRPNRRRRSQNRRTGSS